MYTETPVKQVFTIDSSHAPNLSNPTKVADILVMIQKIENNKLTNKVKQKVTKEINLITSKWEKDFSLEAKNKKAKKIVDVYAENALLQAMPASFGTFQGKNNIFYRVFKRTLSLLKRTPLLLFGVRFGVRFLICQN